jgi:molybdopterin synthase catalytic subunit
MISISVQQADFSHAEEYQKLVAGNCTQGAVVTFTGRVRSTDELKPDDEDITALELECYPGMTEKVLNKIAAEAVQRWSVAAVTIIHRIGKLSSGEQIVFVGVTSSHRKSAFEACEFLIDILKTEAPFWKKEFSEKNQQWVEAKHSDTLQSNKWLEK